MFEWVVSIVLIGFLVLGFASFKLLQRLVNALEDEIFMTRKSTEPNPNAQSRVPPKGILFKKPDVKVPVKIVPIKW